MTAMARSEAKAQVLRREGARPVQVSLFDRERLTAELGDHEAVVNLASSLPSPQRFMMKSAWADCERIRTQGSATLVAAALAAGIPRVVQESVVMIYRDGDDRWIDESWPVDHYPIAVGNHAAESSSRIFAESGRDAIILRFGLFYGPGAAHSEMIMDLARRHIAFQVGRPGTYSSSIHLADAAAAVVAALACPAGTTTSSTTTPSPRHRTPRRWRPLSERGPGPRDLGGSHCCSAIAPRR